MRELTLKDLQQESLNILKDIHQFCISRKIEYSVAYGTLLGAIRHKGFIPWDDDIDIVMPRPYYDRFCREYISSRYKIKNPECDSECMIAFSRVYDDELTISESIVPWCKSKVGVWVDVFPVDSVSDDETLFRVKRNRIVALWKRSLYTRSACGHFRKTKPFLFNMKLAVKKCIFGREFKANKYALKQSDYSKSYLWGETEHWSQLACLDEYEYHPMNWFKSVSCMPFEDTEVLVMNGWDGVLKGCYGDYLQLPPVEQRVVKSDGLIKFYWK